MKSNQKIATVVIFSLISLPLLYLSLVEGSMRGVFVQLMLLFWLLRSFQRGLIHASLEFFIISIPFAISFVIPQLTESAYVSGIYVNYLAPTVYLQDLAVLLSIFSLLFTLDKNEVRKFIRSTYFKFIISLLILLLIHNLYFLQLEVLLSSVRIFMYFSLLIIALYRKELIINTLRTAKKEFFYILTLLILLQFAIAFRQVSGGVDWGLDFLGESQLAAGSVGSSSSEIGGRLFLRGYGTFPHPNLLGGFTALFMTLFLAERIRSSSLLAGGRGVRYLYYLTLFLLLATLFLSFSQSAWLVIFVNFVLYGYWRISKGTLKKEKEIRMPVIALLSEFRPIHERLLLLAASYRYFLDNLFWGVGSGNFVRNFYRYSPTGEAGISLLQPVHNIFVLMLVEYGLIFGLILNLFLLVSMTLRFISSKWRVILLMFATYILVIGNLDHYLLTLPQGMVMLLFALFGYFAQDELTKESATPRSYKN